MYKYKLSKSSKKEFCTKMQEIKNFCNENGIQQSISSDSYYFSINGQKYRVSNHTVAKSNSSAYDDMGNQIRDKYHPDGEESDTIYIFAGKTRIAEIYTDLKNGYKLDKKGKRC